MAKVAVIIAFAYNVKNQTKAIPSILMDLYMSYNQAERIGCKILVITDNTEKPVNNYIEKAILEGLISTQIVNFLALVDARGQLAYFKSEYDLKKKIDAHCKAANNVFLYFSGHGESSKFLFPEYTHRNLYYADPIKEIRISLMDILSTISSASSHSAEIFILIDMCEANKVEMPFLYVYEPTAHYKFMGIRDYPIFNAKKIMCFCNDKAHTFSNKEGSSFTIKFYSKLTTYGAYIMSSLNIEDGIRVCASYPNMVHIPIWFVNTTQTSIWTMECISTISIYENSGLDV